MWSSCSGAYNNIIKDLKQSRIKTNILQDQIYNICHLQTKNITAIVSIKNNNLYESLNSMYVHNNKTLSTCIQVKKKVAVSKNSSLL